MQIQVQDEIRDLQPDVIVEMYLDAKYYQHSPEEIHDSVRLQLQCHVSRRL